MMKNRKELLETGIYLWRCVERTMDILRCTFSKQCVRGIDHGLRDAASFISRNQIRTILVDLEPASVPNMATSTDASNDNRHTTILVHPFEEVGKKSLLNLDFSDAVIDEKVILDRAAREANDTFMSSALTGQKLSLPP